MNLEIILIQINPSKFMNKKSIGILIILIVTILGVSISMNSEEKDDNAVFHLSLIQI